MRRNQWGASLLALLLFSLGLVAGILAHRFYAQSVVSATTVGDVRKEYLSEMRTRVKLTPMQIDQLQTILDDTREKARAVRNRVHPEMVKIKEEQIARVKSILTPEQIPAYSRLVADRERRARLAEQDHK